MNLPIAEQLINSTTRIECSVNGQSSQGTGFFFTFNIDNKLVPAIITNRHVIHGATSISFYLTRKKSDGTPDYGNHINHQIINISNRCFFHVDTNVDLACLLIGDIVNTNDFFYVTVNSEVLADQKTLESLTAIEDVTMIGYPNGIWDSKNNLPIVRRGITATPLNIDYAGKTEFIIDCACFPGSSGSPVFLFNQGAYSDNKGKMIMEGGRVILLGILYAGTQHTATGEIRIINVPTGNIPITQSNIPNHLGVCIKSTRVLDFEDQIKKSGMI